MQYRRAAMRRDLFVLAGTLDIAAVLIGVSVAYAAEEMPKELVLQCEGKSMLFLDSGSKPELRRNSFKHLLRFRDRIVVNPEVPQVILGKDCSLQNGKIRCEHRETTYNADSELVLEETSWSLHRERDGRVEPISDLLT